MGGARPIDLRTIDDVMDALPIDLISEPSTESSPSTTEVSGSRVSLLSSGAIIVSQQDVKAPGRASAKVLKLNPGPRTILTRLAPPLPCDPAV